MISPNLKGSEFEGETRELLIQLRDEHPNILSLIEKPSLQLQNGEIVIPDFQLIVKYSAEKRHYFIECQDRTRYSHSILHKIQHIRAKQALKTFFFVYRENISPELENKGDYQTPIALRRKTGHAPIAFGTKKSQRISSPGRIPTAVAPRVSSIRAGPKPPASRR